MVIEKPINNNIVSARDENGREIVVMGKGIGFKAKEGGEIPQQSIEKIFKMETQNETDRLKALFSSLPVEHIRISDDIIAYANRILPNRLNRNIYITLTDHISFAILRFNEGMLFNNALLTEVRRFYPQEFAVGEYALELVKRNLDIQFPVDEAASIALHIVNAEYDTSISEAMHVTQLSENLLQFVRQLLGGLNEESLFYDRFITHLKFLAQRIYKGETLKDNDPRFSQAIADLYPKDFSFGQKVAGYVKENFEYFLIGEEIAYLALYIHRMYRPHDEGDNRDA